MVPVRRWGVRVGMVGLALTLSAIVTAGAFGIAYGVACTPSGWNSQLVFSGAVLAVAALLGLASLPLMLWADRINREHGKPELLAAVCVVLTTTAFGLALHDQALHGRGRAETAVVVSLHASGGEFSVSRSATVTDLSGHLLGEVAAGGLAVGERITVTVDPRDRMGVQRGLPPRAPTLIWAAAAALAVLQALVCAAMSLFRKEEHRA